MSGELKNAENGSNGSHGQNGGYAGGVPTTRAVTRE